jgi:hypothetical protein
MEVTVTYCDKCNIKQERTKMFKIPADWCSILGIELAPGEKCAYSLRGVFTGSFADAQKYDGWTETDYGHCCPLCVFEQAQLDAGGETQVIDPVEALALVKGK